MDPVEARLADEPLDELDDSILYGVRTLWDTLDPVPSTLVEQIQFAMSLEAVETEVMRLTERAEFALARGEEHSRLITFDSDSLTIMIKIGANRNGTIRLDGWLTPPDSRPIELRTKDGSMNTSSDDGGRFALDGIRPGIAQLVVRPTGRMPLDGSTGGMSNGGGRTVTTPSILL
jgi:hypothetical protein